MFVFSWSDCDGGVMIENIMWPGILNLLEWKYDDMIASFKCV